MRQEMNVVAQAGEREGDIHSEKVRRMDFFP